MQRKTFLFNRQNPRRNRQRQTPRRAHLVEWHHLFSMPFSSLLWHWFWRNFIKRKVDDEIVQLEKTRDRMHDSLSFPPHLVKWFLPAFFFDRLHKLFTSKLVVLEQITCYALNVWLDWKKKKKFRRDDMRSFTKTASLRLACDKQTYQQKLVHRQTTCIESKNSLNSGFSSLKFFFFGYERNKILAKLLLHTNFPLQNLRTIGFADTSQNSGCARKVPLPFGRFQLWKKPWNYTSFCFGTVHQLLLGMLLLLKSVHLFTMMQCGVSVWSSDASWLSIDTRATSLEGFRDQMPVFHQDCW